mmetsp:Transcript_49071/g.113714  ORF Transcript_49071/g.113714 Transcript_49071/m.113714 type:complete len:96 (-) Transcript_49071:420-707(-)
MSGPCCSHVLSAQSSPVFQPLLCRGCPTTLVALLLAKTCSQLFNVEYGPFQRQQELHHCMVIARSLIPGAARPKQGTAPWCSHRPQPQQRALQGP